MSAPKRLFRTPSTGRIAGVCAGIADYLDADVTLVRLGWIILSIFPGWILGGVLAYAVAAIIMPIGEPVALAQEGHRLRRSVADRKLGGVCGGLAEYFHLDATLVRVVWAILTFIPGAIVFGVLGYLIAWFIIPADAASAMPAAVPAA